MALPPAAHAAAECDPGPLTDCLRFSATGADQTWTVPSGVTSVTVEVWGAGGGGPGASWFSSSAGGGSGGYTTGTIGVYPGQQLRLMVGSPGQAGSTTPTYGGGGAGGVGEGANSGSSGGGMSAIFRGSTLLVAAGGGGGASIGSLGVPDGVAAGPGGGAQGGQDTAPQSSGRAGTQSAGGAAATGYGSAMCDTDPTAGGKYAGGNGGSIPTGPTNSEGGGGGGGGYYGGGGGSCQDNSESGKQNGPGGGGSGHIGTGVTGGNTETGSPSAANGQIAQPAGTGSSNYETGIATGGGTGSGGAGSIVLTYTPSAAPVPAANPRISDKCALDYSVMVDASTSVEEAQSVDTVRTALDSLMVNLVGTGSTVRLDQFGTAAGQLAPRTTVTNTAVAPGGVLSDGVARYFNPQPAIPAQTWGYRNGAWQDPANWVRNQSPSKGWTNWDAGLQAMAAPADRPDVAVFVTDGDPTAFTLDRAGDPNGGAGSRNIGIATGRGSAQDETLARAVAAANALKADGVRILVVGVSSALDNPASQARLVEISGPKVLTDTELSTINSLNDVDVALAKQFGSLQALMSNIVAASCNSPVPDDNPEAPEKCSLDYGLMLDASTSVADEGQVETVRTAAGAFLQGLQGTGSRASVGQFGTTAEQLAPAVEVTAGTTSPNGVLGRAVEQYFNPQPGVPTGGVYGYRSGPWKDPANWRLQTAPSQGWTNWDAGLTKLGKQPLPDVAIFVTDGDPTAFNLNESGDPHGGRGSDHVGIATARDSAKQPTIDRAILQANALKQKGVKVMVVGVGTAFTQADSQVRLMKISGPQLVQNAALRDITSINEIDAAVTDDFAKLSRLLRNYAEISCGPVTTVEVTGNPDPSITMGKPTVLVDGVQTDGTVQSVTPICQLNGQRWNNGKGPNSPGCHVDQGNHRSEFMSRSWSNGKAVESAAAAKKVKKKKIKVVATPTCNRGLVVGVKIKSKAKGKRAVTWKQTWQVTGNGVRCTIRAKG